MNDQMVSGFAALQNILMYMPPTQGGTKYVEGKEDYETNGKRQ